MSATEPTRQDNTVSNDSDTSVGTIKAGDKGHDDSSLRSFEDGGDETTDEPDRPENQESSPATSKAVEEEEEDASSKPSMDKQSEPAEESQTGAQDSPPRPPQHRGHQHRSSASAQNRRRVRSSTVHTIDVQEETTRASRFTLWETRTRFYLIAYNTAQSRFRVLKIDRSPEGQQGSTKSDDPGDEVREKEQQHKDPRQTATPSSTKSSNASSSRFNTFASSSSTPDFWDLGVTADHAVYDRHQITELLDMVSEGNRSTGGLKEVGHFFGLVGFIRFTSTYYMVLISRRSVVALMGGHYIYHCDETKILPVCHPSSLASVSGRTKAMDQEEARLLHTFKQVDLGKNFYFSYTYDLTRTLQENLTGRGRSQMAHDQGLAQKDAQQTAWGFCEKFIWNHHLLLPAFKSTVNAKVNSNDSSESTADEWIIPLCYGFVDQAKLSIMNRTIHVTLIARRSRHFAGARFLKRGVNEAGHVANDVETEQIVSDALTTAFYAPEIGHGQAGGGSEEEDTSFAHSSGSAHDATGSKGLAQNPRFTSYVMHRGSIPIYWTQDSTNMSPRPPIEISVVDPYYSAAALHFDDMFARYGSPIIILNLIKSKEKTPRETKLLSAFGECIGYLNQFLPEDKKMPYIAWDMSRASKSQDQDVIGVLEDIAEETVESTRFFHSGPEPTRFESHLQGKSRSSSESATGTGSSTRRDTILLQTGTVRVNCVDCLDRTNAAQFVIGKAAFGQQLHALGLLEHPSLPFDSDAVDMLTEMYHDLGDTIALQYGGSHLVNTMETYRKINQWTSHSRDMLEGLKRYYSNSFVDADKQAAINLFLGIDKDAPNFVADGGTGGVGAVVSSKRTSYRRSYQKWFTPVYLEEIRPTPERLARLQEFIEQERSFFWAEYYRPRLFTDLMRHHAFKMTAVHQRQPQAVTYSGSGAVTTPSKRGNHDQPRRSSVVSTSGETIHASSSFGNNNYPSMASLSSIAASSTMHGDSAFTSSSVYSRPSTEAHSAMTGDTSILVTSPFISRLPGGSTSGNRAAKSGHSHLRNSSISSISSDATAVSHPIRGSSTVASTDSTMLHGKDRSGSTSTGVAPSADSKALIGGVRRWMSLNQGGGAGGKKNRRLSGRGKDGVQDGPAGKTDPSISDKGSLIDPKPSPASTSIGGWTNPFSLLHVNPSHPHPASVLLENWYKPAVADEEAREYDLWLRQFKGNVQLESNLAEWDGLLNQEIAAASAGIADERRREAGATAGYGGGGGGGGAAQGSGPTALGSNSANWHSSDPNLSDADLQMYIQSVRKARLPALSHCITLDPTTTTSTSGPAGGVAGGGTVLSPADEAVLKAYAAWETTARQMQGAPFRGVTETRLKAYRGWATIGVCGR